MKKELGSSKGVGRVIQLSGDHKFTENLASSKGADWEG
jgi:hypothetical protein